MRATDHTTAADSTTLSIRLPVALAEQVAAVATRDANPISAAVRRLISLGLRAEAQDEVRRVG